MLLILEEAKFLPPEAKLIGCNLMFDLTEGQIKGQFTSSTTCSDLEGTYAESESLKIFMSTNGFVRSLKPGFPGGGRGLIVFSADE